VALRAGILGASAKITEPMLATIDRDDLETTVRTLNEITQASPGDTGPPRHYGGKPMTTQKLPGTDAARHGTGASDLTIMLAARCVPARPDPAAGRRPPADLS